MPSGWTTRRTYLIFHLGCCHGLTRGQPQNQPLLLKLCPLCTCRFNQLQRRLAPYIAGKSIKNIDRTISTSKRVAITLYRLGSGSSFSVVGRQFGVADNTAGLITRGVCHAICKHVVKDFIKPSYGARLAGGVEGFTKKGFPL